MHRFEALVRRGGADALEVVDDRGQFPGGAAKVIELLVVPVTVTFAGVLIGPCAEAGPATTAATPATATTAEPTANATRIRGSPSSTGHPQRSSTQTLAPAASPLT
jgi:hypothetical protein